MVYMVSASRFVTEILLTLLLSSQKHRRHSAPTFAPAQPVRTVAPTRTSTLHGILDFLEERSSWTL
jgi:hypothetical protein